METLLTGASGLLGRAVISELTKHFPVMGLAFHRSGPGLKTVDLRDTQAVRALIKEIHPQCIVHLAAERRPNECENNQEGTRLLNVEATRVLAESAREVGAWMLYLSTDYVFDGTAPPYTPKDRPNPLNLYGKSKLQGEAAIQAIGKEHLILRVPVLYGPVLKLEESAITAIARDVFAGEEKKYDNWAVRYPTHVQDVAIVIRQLIHRRKAIRNLRGIFHWSGNEAFTKFRIAQIIAEEFSIPVNTVQANDSCSGGAPRPQNSQLDTSLLEELGIGAQRVFSTAIREAVAPFA